MPLEFDLNRAAPAACALDCVIVGVFADGGLTASAQAIDAASGGQLKALGARGDLAGKLERTTLLHDLPGVQAPRVLVVGLGEPAKFDTAAFGKAIAAAVRALRTGASRSALCTLTELAVPRADGQPHDAAWMIRHAVTAADHASYRFSGLGFRQAKAGDEQGLRGLSLSGDDAIALAHGIAIAAGVHFARELGNLPPNVCNPAFLAAQARKLADDHADVVCEVLERAQMEQLGMGALLAVARGSANAPKLIVLRYNGGGDAKPYALVGKGITFDTGGINLKTQGGIEEMKFDMCGGATVMGTFLAAATMRLPLNLVTVVPAVENMPDADAYRPSDVLTSMSGKTIEVGNTDAEGRLILCDALTYVQRFEPQATIDVATLTGACLVALGKVATGLMSRHDDLADELLAAGTTSHDRAWRLPLWDDYQSLLDSTFADVYNVGGRWAGAVTAGCFLSRFTEGQRWAHLDIAGSGSDEGRKGLATGRPVGLLSQWLLDRVA